MWLSCTKNLAHAAGLFALGATLGGCFQPLYGSTGSAGQPALRQALGQIEVAQIALPNGSPFVRMAVKVQNDLRFNFTGGAGSTGAPTHRLVVQISGNQSIVAAASAAGYPIITNYAFHASYSLIEIASNKRVLGGTTVSTVSFDPTGAQRFARYSGAEDAKLRAAKEIADNISTRIASFMVSGT